MAIHPLIQLIRGELNSEFSGGAAPAGDPPGLKALTDKNLLRDFIKSSPIEGDLYYALMDDKKEFLFETGGKHIKKLLHKKEQGIRNQREALRCLSEANREEEVVEIQSKNHLHYISIALRYNHQMIGSFIAGGFFISNGKATEDLHREWCVNNGFEYTEASEILKYVPEFDIEYVGKLKQYFLTLSLLLRGNSNHQGRDAGKKAARDNGSLKNVLASYGNVIHSACEAIFITDHKLNLLFLNKTLKNLVTPQNEPGSLTAILKASDRKRLQEKFRDQILTQEENTPPASFQMEIEMPFENREKPVAMLLEAEPLVNHAMEVKGLFALVKHKETDPSRTPELLTAQKGLFYHLLDSSHMGIFYYDSEGVILDFNKKFTEIAGLTENQLRGASLFSIWKNQKLLKPVRQSLNGEYTHYEGNFSLRNHSCYVRAFFQGLEKDTPSGYKGIGMIEEITEWNR